MILDRQAFNYKGKVLLEKVFFQAPFHNEVLFENEGCLLYFRHVDAKIFSAHDDLPVENKDAVLLRCGTYFFDLIRKTDKARVEVIAIHLYPQMLQDLYVNDLPKRIQQLDYSKKSQLISPQDVISRFVESLDLYFENPALVNDHVLELKIKELVLLLIQTQSIGSILELITDLYSSKVVNIRKVVELHLYANFRIEQLAKLCHMSLSSFKRAFKKEFNDSPQNYILSKKLEKAKELLVITELPVGQIAYDSGFDDPLYFSRLFKKRTGTSPSAFREAALS